MLRWLTGTIISGDGSRPNGDIEKVTGRPLITFQDFAGRNAHGMDPSGGQVTTPPKLEGASCGGAQRIDFFEDRRNNLLPE